MDMVGWGKWVWWGREGHWNFILYAKRLYCEIGPAE